MNGKFMKTAIASVLAVSALGFQAAAPTNAAEGDFNLTIMHTNDTHANLDKIANRATLVKQIRAEHPNNLLVDAGDVFSGTLYFNTFQGQADLEFMNLLKYDAMTFGNHEFDLGSTAEGHAALGEFIGGADFPFVSANVNVAKNPILAPLDNNTYTKEFENGEIYNGIIKVIDGEEVGIFGLTTEETVAISSPGTVEFSNYITAAKEAVAAFQAAGVNKIVALTHLGFDDSKTYDNDQLLANAVAGIDVIVGGHTHTKLAAPVVNNTHGEPTLIVQAEQYNNFLGQLDLTFNEAGVITSHTGKLHEVGKAAADAEFTAKLKPYADEIAAIKNQSTGAVAKVALNGGRGITGVRASETNLGNLITDGMLATAKTIDPETTIAVQNGGGIRASIDAGDITVGEVLTVMPFGNALAIMELTGTELKAALEHSVKDYPNEFGGFLHVAGLKFTFDPSAPVGSRVTDIQVDKNGKYKKFKEKDTYKVATNTFTAKGGDGYAPFAAAYANGRVSEPGNVDYEMFIDYIKSLKEVNPQMENRIVAKTPALSKSCEKRKATPAPDCVGSR
ncbi:bifunctional metallophosphatase/5'-nucleotidase [Planococcus shixiaomingii]|uniref:bifunctional metallophosphatase/5'-nucleotidase n=1 Tax=Planococcus shixiaomingii TaxID=3058393 RepID=UPI002624A482|nr:5'-nucleotidase C-terminal domain-containing protein [Planococcus sp. N022]WKA53103.1 5'-nucleotidase C-terminal domain-containing protein [Planococcus sp. N022]